MIWICVAAFAVGVFGALFAPIVIPVDFLKYTAPMVLYIAVWTAEAVRRMLYKKINLKIFISGFFCGLIFVLLFIIVGEKLDLDIYPVCTIVLGIVFIKSCVGIFRYFTGQTSDKTVKLCKGDFTDGKS